MAQEQYDAQRLAELRAMEHRALAQYALEIEERLRRWRDLTMAVQLGYLAIAAAAGGFLGWLACVKVA